MFKLVMDKKLKYTIVSLVIILFFTVIVDAIGMNHDISQISKNDPNRDKVDDDKNLIFDESDEAHTILVKNIENFADRCENGELAIGINTDGTVYCQPIAVRCGQPSSDNEQLCLIEDSTNDWDR